MNKFLDDVPTETRPQSPRSPLVLSVLLLSNNGRSEVGETGRTTRTLLYSDKVRVSDFPIKCYRKKRRESKVDFTVEGSLGKVPRVQSRREGRREMGKGVVGQTKAEPSTVSGFIG